MAELTQPQKDALIALEAVGGAVCPGELDDAHWEALVTLVDLDEATRLVNHGWFENEAGTLVACASLTELGMAQVVAGFAKAHSGEDA